VVATFRRVSDGVRTRIEPPARLQQVDLRANGSKPVQQRLGRNIQIGTAAEPGSRLFSRSERRSNVAQSIASVPGT